MFVSRFKAMQLLLLASICPLIASFAGQKAAPRAHWPRHHVPIGLTQAAQPVDGEEQVGVNKDIPEESDQIKSLFAWINRAIVGDERYHDLDIGLSTVFGGPSPQNVQLQYALALLPDDEEQPVGPILSLQDRQLNSLGPLGAGQWTKQYDEKYPHSLLNVRDIDHVLAWQKSLKRTCRQSLRRAVGMNYTVVAKPITGDEPAPHSSLAVFRCIVEHELRLSLKGKLDEDGGDERVDPSVFFGAICEAVERYVISTKMAGTIYEYRSDPAGPIAIIAHEVRKGRVLRGQWCYMTDEAAKHYGWFRAVHDLVDRAVQEKDIDVVDLGPNGVDGKLDAHVKLKQRYGFQLVEDWPAIADYRGSFW